LKVLLDAVLLFQNAELFYDLAVVYYRLNQFVKAQEALIVALEFKPDYPEAINLLNKINQNIMSDK